MVKEQKLEQEIDVCERKIVQAEERARRDEATVIRLRERLQRLRQRRQERP